MFYRILLVLTLSVASGCVDSTGSSDSGFLEVREVVRSRIPELADTTGPFLIHPWAMGPWKDSLAVVDLRQSAVIVLPWTLEGGRELGIQGEGPGELRQPQGVGSIGDTLGVFDRSNGRLSWFDPEGRFLYGRQLMILGIVPTFHLRPGGAVVVPNGMSSHYALVDSAGDQVPSLPRPEGSRPAREGPITSNLIVSTTNGFAVVDAENGQVVFAGPDGSSTAFPIPLDIMAGIDQRLDSLRAGDPSRERVLNPIIAAGEAPEGVLVWFTGRGNPSGAVIDESGNWRPITVSEETDGFPTNPNDVLLRGRELFLLTSDGIQVFRVSG